MFNRKQKTPENSAAQPFLNAQAERISRKYNQLQQPVESHLGEVVDTTPHPLDVGDNVEVPAIEDKDAFVKNHVIELMKLMKNGFETAQAAGLYYDPLDDKTFIGHESFESMNADQKELAFKYLSSYLMSLEREHGKPTRGHAIGRHVLGGTLINQQISGEVPLDHIR